MTRRTTGSHAAAPIAWATMMIARISPVAPTARAGTLRPRNVDGPSPDEPVEPTAGGVLALDEAAAAPGDELPSGAGGDAATSLGSGVGVAMARPPSAGPAADGELVGGAGDAVGSRMGSELLGSGRVGVASGNVGVATGSEMLGSGRVGVGSGSEALGAGTRPLGSSETTGPTTGAMSDWTGETTGATSDWTGETSD